MNVIIRALKETDIWLLHKWINDPEVLQFTNYYRPISEMEQKEWFYSIHKNKDRFIFGIELVENQNLIGTCGLYDVDWINRKSELKIKLCDKEQRGKGYGSEVLCQLLLFGFQDINLYRIWLKVLEDNHAAIKLYEKFGFENEGLLRHEMIIQGRYRNVIIMGLLSNEFKKN